MCNIASMSLLHHLRTETLNKNFRQKSSSARWCFNRLKNSCDDGPQTFSLSLGFVVDGPEPAGHVSVPGAARAAAGSVARPAGPSWESVCRVTGRRRSRSTPSQQLPHTAPGPDEAGEGQRQGRHVSSLPPEVR